MPRTPRPITPGYPHHVISRFVNRDYRLRGTVEREAYLERLRRAHRHPGIVVASFALMSSHVHKTIVGNAAPVGAFLHRVNTAFGRWVNEAHGTFGPVFAERPTSIVVCGEEQLARVVAYHHNNPGRAGLVVCPSQSMWTSHRAFLGLDPCPDFLDVEWALSAMGFSASASGRINFHDYVRSRQGTSRDPSLVGVGASSVELAQRVVAAGMQFYGANLNQLSKPNTPQFRAARLVLISTAVEVFGVRVDHLALALGLSASFVSRLRKRSCGSASQDLVELVITPHVQAA